MVSWTAPSDLGGAPITGYVVVLGGQTQRLGPTVTSVQLDGLPAGALQATVRATNNAGTGAAATSPSVEIRLFPPFNSEAAFVTQQYRDFLDRAPDAGGLAHWQGVTGADGSNVDEVILSFMRSGEFAPRRAVTRFYLAYFDRGPDRGGLDFWAAEVFSGRRDLVAVSNYFASSPELLARYGQLSNESFVALVYNNVLRREPDLSGYNYWLTQLNNGMPRGHVMIQFSESAEFVAATAVPVDVTLTYSGMLNRIPDPVGYEFWVGLVSRQPNALNTLIEGFFASAEYASLITP